MNVWPEGFLQDINTAEEKEDQNNSKYSEESFPKKTMKKESHQVFERKI